MRFLIDRCAGHRLAEWLRQQGHDVSEVRDRGADPGDVAVLEWSTAEERVLVTLDKDFGALLYLDRKPHAGLIRLPDVPAERRIAAVEQIIRGHARELSEGAVVTVRGGRIRISTAREDAS